MLFVTGGAGFIGANFVLDALARSDESILTLDKLTYAGNRENLAAAEKDSRHIFTEGDIGDTDQVVPLLLRYQPRAIVHFAAESHVDRSIHGPENFIQTNIEGTFRLLEAARVYWNGLEGDAKNNFRFLHISTDEVYGSLESGDEAFTETHRYRPNSPYAASKAAADHLVRAWHQTYGLPVIVTNCSNNYGPFQFPEKLIPLLIVNALAGKELPIYGDGKNIRDWLYVKDHTAALFRVLEAGKPGETYNIGGQNEKTNLEVVQAVCALLDELAPRPGTPSYSNQITFVADRPGHDKRYATNGNKIERALGWKPVETFATGLRKTVQWYLENPQWIANVQSGAYRAWIEKNYDIRSDQKRAAG
jgi:dTDP-glucose 4,6-dehydratase